MPSVVAQAGTASVPPYVLPSFIGYTLFESFVPMLDPIRYITINPAAAADVDIMNVELRLHRNYVDGLVFTHHEVLPDGRVQFYYDVPDGLSHEQETGAVLAVREVHSAFRMRSNNE